MQKRLQEAERLPVLLFERVKGHAMPVVANLFATKRHLALDLDCSPAEVVERFASASKHRLLPKTVAGGPVKEVVLTGEDSLSGVGRSGLAHRQRAGGRPHPRAPR